MASWIEQLQSMFGRERVIAAREAIQSHSYDEWPIAVKLRQQGLSPYSPAAIFHPRTTAEVSQVLSWASRNRVPVTPWGAGSSVTGAPLPLHGGLCLDMSDMHRMLALDDKNLLVKVEAGIIGHVLEQALQARGLTLNHSPQSLDRSTVGGWLATRASGQFSSRWGSIVLLERVKQALDPAGILNPGKLGLESAGGEYTDNTD